MQYIIYNNKSTCIFIHYVVKQQYIYNKMYKKFEFEKGSRDRNKK